VSREREIGSRSAFSPGAFHSPVEGGGAWEPNTEMTDYQWWLARADGQGWQLVSFGY